MHLGAPTGTGHTLCSFLEGSGIVHALGDEFANAARLHPLVTDEREGVLQPLHELRRVLV